MYKTLIDSFDSNKKLQRWYTKIYVVHFPYAPLSIELRNFLKSTLIFVKGA